MLEGNDHDQFKNMILAPAWGD